MEPHVPQEIVEAARALAQQEQIDVVVAMGGGSAMGVGKGVVAGEGRSLIAIPTTYAGSEMTPVFGTTDRREKRKSVRRDDAVLPKLVIYDPEVTVDLSPELTASTGMNALAHCVEACYARDVNPLVPAVALEGIRRIVRSLPLCVTNGRNLDAREDLLTGAYLAGFSIANATMALHHGLCHVFGGRTGVPHGVLNAIMLPHVMRFNADAVPEVMNAIALNFPPPIAGEGRVGAVGATAALVAWLPVPQRLRDAGVPEAVLESVAAEAAGNSTVQANPKPVSEASIRELLRAAW
ncbi:MAG: maleylacetate reductase [Chloroflexota bacterium]|nr:maleylacetate reductase [Chloroflexota bacterium]